MGLPHILVRFYTNPDGSAARRTTVRVLGLLGAFYLFPAVYGLLGRAFTPELYVTGDTDSVVLRVPAAAWPGLAGRHPRRDRRRGRVRRVHVDRVRPAGRASPARSPTTCCPGSAQAAARAVPGRRRRRHGPARAARARHARASTSRVLVGWAFALAASTFCPLLLLGVWWPRLTARGAAAGHDRRRDRRHRDDRRRPDRRRVRGDRASARSSRSRRPSRCRSRSRRWSCCRCAARPRDVGAAMAALHVPEAVSP